jgi:NADH-quinone oxidoreductase subunit M
VTDFPWLSVIGGVPLVGALLVGTLRAQLARFAALAISLIVLGLTVAMSTGFDVNGGVQFRESHAWIPQFGTRYTVGVNGVGLSLVVLTAVLVPVVVLASWRDTETIDASSGSVSMFFALMLALESLLIGVFAARDVFLFYVLFEAMLIPMYFLIGRYGGPRRSYAAVKFLLYSLLGGLLMLAAVIGLYVMSVRQLGTGTFDLETLITEVEPSIPGGRWLFAGFFVAFAVKAPLWPFHTWLPDAAAEATPGTAVMLVGVMDKVGTFGMIAYCLPLFPEASRFFAPTVVVLAVMGILYGALVAIGQTDLKRLIAYTSVSHFGFICLGIFAMTTQAQSGATLYMVNHGFSTAALFLIVGFLISRRGSRLIDSYGGVYRVAPILAGTFLVAGLSSLALPGLSSFVSEFLVLLGTYTRYPVAGVVATLGIILAALYILIMYQRTMTGPTNPDTETLPDLRAREIWAVAPLLAVIVALGVYPKPLLDAITPTIGITLQQLGVTDPSHPVVIEGADQ